MSDDPANPRVTLLVEGTVRPLIDEPLVLQQAVNQFLTWILRVFPILFQRRIARQQHLGLDVDQGGRHVDELGAQIDVHFARLFHEFQILGSDGSDGDVFDVDLLLADQVQQQVQRSLILLQMEIEWR